MEATKASVDPIFDEVSPSVDHLTMDLSSEQEKRLESGDQVTAAQISECALCALTTNRILRLKRSADRTK